MMILFRDQWTIKIKEDSSEESEADEDEQNKAADSKDPVEKEKKDPVLSKIVPEEKAFLHKLGDEWFLVRPSDNQMVELKYSDPILAAIKVGDKWVLICDSKSKEAGSKSKFTQTLLGGRKATQVTDSVLLQECQKCRAYCGQLKHMIVHCVWYGLISDY